MHTVPGHASMTAQVVRAMGAPAAGTTTWPWGLFAASSAKLAGTSQVADQPARHC